MRVAAVAVLLGMLAGPAQLEAQQQARAAVIEALQAAGVNLATAPLCEMIGYELSEDEPRRYAASQVEDAKASGMFEEQAYSYVALGLDGQSAADKNKMESLARRMEEGKASARATALPLVNSLIERCDQLTIRTETRALFSYVPPNDEAARNYALRSMRLIR